MASSSSSLRVPVPERSLSIEPSRAQVTDAAQSEARKPAPRWFAVIGCVGLAVYALFLSRHMTVVAGGSDSSGYLNSARLFAAGELQVDLRVPEEFGAVATVDRAHFSPQGFGVFEGNLRLPPSYPTGLPLHFALASRILGWTAGPFFVQLLAAVAAVWLSYFTARAMGLHHTLAAAGAVVLATFPVFIFTSIQTLSDTMATTWALAAVACMVKARGATAWAVAAGAAFAMGVLVRPTNVLIAPALVVLLGWNVRRLVAFGLGGLPGAAWFAYYNHTLYGGAFKSGYGDIWACFAWEFGWPTAAHFAEWLLKLLPAAMLLWPLAALAHRATRTRAWGAMLLLFSAHAGVYLFYNVSHDTWWCLRFILPAVAALILAGLMGAEAMARWADQLGWRGVRPTLAAVLVGGAIANSWYWTQNLSILHVPGYERAYAEAAEKIRGLVPPKAIVLCSAASGTIYFYTELPTLVYDSITPPIFEEYVAKARGAGRAIYAAVFDIEEEDALRQRCPGNWHKITAAGNLGIWELR
ncbi:MAG: glycosyltransferase family 39 protein [Opitutaceae bacterium]|nr:glycosyltransferase family 39 protein [Opitutaceae bacterium]